jgi:hypothetical protein
MATDINYNGVTLRNVLTRQFSQSPVYDASGTDVLYWRFQVLVECVISVTNFNRAVAGDPNVLGLEIDAAVVSAASPQEILNAARSLLAQDRGAFSMQMEGVTVLAATALTAVNNGPRARPLDVFDMSSGMLKLSWGIEIDLLTCPDGGDNSQFPVINNRWTVADDIDKSFRTRRQWSGKLTLARTPDTFLETLPRSPHYYRFLCVPPLAEGWRRENIRFFGSANGLELAYDVVDQELANEAAPYPAVAIDFRHQKEFNRFGSPKVQESIGVTLRGAAKVNRTYVVLRAVQVVMSRANIGTDALRRKRILQAMRVSEQFNEEQSLATCDAVIACYGGDVEDGAVGTLDIKPLGRTLVLPPPDGGADDLGLDYTPTKAWHPGPWGSGLPLVAATLSAAWQSPCSGGHAMYQGGAAPSAPEDPEQGESEPAEVTYQETQQTNLPGPEFNEDAQDAIYEHCRLESRLVIDNGIVQLPLAKAIETTDDPPRKKTCKNIRLSAPTAKRHVTMQLERIGHQPKLFEPKDFLDSNGVEHTLEHFDVTHQAPEMMAGGSLMHAADAKYIFALDEVPTYTEPIPIGALLWDTRTAEDNRVPSSVWIDPESERGLS